MPRDSADMIGTFCNARTSDKGIRADLVCLRGAEGLHPQAAALRDNIQHHRPFGGFSPRFDFTIDPVTGEVQTILAVESIDLVPQPASVKSALEGEPEFVTPAQLAAIEARLAAVEARPVAAVEAVKTPAARSEPIPEPPKPAIQTTAKNFAEFVRS
jgi:hypothetical protein